MSRLFIIADVHGNYSIWQKLLSKLQSSDTLVIAGDLFGNRYPDTNNPDYQPEIIRQEYQALKNQKYFVYGNCDLPEFFPEQKYNLTFDFENKKILLYHGDDTVPSGDNDIIITGHTHVSEIKDLAGKLYINPGSVARPHDGFSGYAIYQNGQAEFIALT